MGKTVTVSATRFRATCPGLLDRVANGEIDRLEVTKRGKVVAVLGPPDSRHQVDALFGALKGTITRADALDLTAPAFDGVIEAQRDATSRC